MLQVQHSTMASKISTVIFKIFLLCLQLHPAKSQTWIRVGYYGVEQKVFPISEINSSLFTHLINCCADLNSTSYTLSLSNSDEKYFSTFTETVKQKNPSVTTLLSIGGPDAEDSIFSSMVNNSFNRKSFIDSSITTARRYGFEGLDFYWASAETASDMSSLSILFEEWRDAITLEARNSSKSELIITAAVDYSPDDYLETYPIDSMQQYLDWIHVNTYDYSTPENSGNFTAAPSALYDPTNIVYTDSGIRGWIEAGLSANKLVLSLVYYGYAWKLVNSTDNGIGAPANGPAISQDGVMIYSEIKNSIEQYKLHVMYNSTYVVNYCTVESSWIGFDDVEAIRAKVSYAKEKGLLGYSVWQVSYDANWVLSQAAALQDAITNPTAHQEDNKSGQNKWPHRFLVIILPITAAFMFLLGLVIYFCWMRKLKSKESVESVQESTSLVNNAAAAGDFNGNSPTLILYSLADIETATDKFSFENKLGEGGYGPVFKGVLQDGLEVAVKKLSKTSIQGFEEFKNELGLLPLRPC
ncbi:hypothetical protein LWI29_018912 [Acer saccharum]|uniref:Uncharacterized protein n=1 Tax=Acer saccharum TaxID=4024 RepID=A0AA39SVV6_ACESA|nr:hypothetical protein LWI29_018912 [Acer saccharum]